MSLAYDTCKICFYSSSEINYLIQRNIAILTWMLSLEIWFSTEGNLENVYLQKNKNRTADSKVYLLAPSNKPIRQPNHTFFSYPENIPARKSNMGIRATEYNPYKLDFVINCKQVHSNSRAVACELFYNKDHLVLFTL